MKNIMPVFVVLFSTTTLVGCGGGSSNSTTTNTTVTTPVLSCKSGVSIATSAKATSLESTTGIPTLSLSAKYYDLVIDNGRGTRNNQYTENPNN